MPQIFLQYQSTIDQFEGGQDNGRTTQVFSEAIETGILEPKFYAFEDESLYSVRLSTQSGNVNKGLRYWWRLLVNYRHVVV